MSFLRRHKLSLFTLLVLLGALFIYEYMPRAPQINDPHLAHKKIIADRLAGRGIPEMELNVVFDHPKKVPSGTPVTLSWKMYDAKTGALVTKFDRNMEKILHLVVTNDALTYFDHVHPDFNAGTFSISYAFPEEDLYWLYLDFQPTGSTEIQKSFTIQVGASKISPGSRDMSLTKRIGDYAVELSSTFKARDIDLAKSHLTFTLREFKTGKPVTDLRPYLGAFGHLVMINEADHSYIHVHPLNTDLSNDRSGPTVEFYPFDLRTGTLPPGRYRLFAQFNPSSGLFTADFTVDFK